MPRGKSVTKLSLENLKQLGRAVSVPSYERSQLSPGILHFGVGNFHRAHLAVYLDALFNQGLDHDWAVIGAGVMPHDELVRSKLAEQDFLTTVVEQDNDLSTAHVTGAMIDFIPPSQRARIMFQLERPEIRIVSLTVTEGGYMINPATGTFDPSHPTLQRDAQHPDDPLSVFGLILHGIKSRRAKGIPPFTVMSCDNVPHNGVVTKNAVAGLARLTDPDLADWIERSVSFPNAMVDRITPATTDREREIAAKQFGVDDAWPVFCEEFKQWVVQDRFPSGRPRWEKVGAQFVDDVTPWEYMKIRILNGGHASIAYLAGLLDIHFVHEAMQTPLVKSYLKKLTDEEIRPTVHPVPATDLTEYQALIDRRFSNPKIGDTIRRLCFDGYNRQPKFIVPPMVDLLAQGKSINGLALESALWCRYCFGVSSSGKHIEPNDPIWDQLQERAAQAKRDPIIWLKMQDVYGEVGAHPELMQHFSRHLTAIWDNGVEAAVRAYLAS
jgi:mannitol 2-dehydrogenase